MNALTKIRFKVWLFGKLKIPLIGYVRPKVMKITDEELIMKIKLRYRTKNHLKSMYFGALSIGADTAGALHAFYYADKMNQKMSLAFKSFHAQFIKRPESDVTFISKEGLIVKEAFERTVQSKERVNQNINIEAFTNYPEKPEKVAEFILELSVKAK